MDRDGNVGPANPAFGVAPGQNQSLIRTPKGSSISDMANPDYVVFQGRLDEYLRRVEAGELSSQLQASHAPPCKFQTAAVVISGINNVVPIVHGPRGCTYSIRGVRVAGCQYRGRPYEPTVCTALNESHVVFGGEGRLARAILEVDQKYHPDLIVVMSTCCPGITGDDVEGIARQARGQVKAEITTIRSEGFGGDFRSGHEQAFRVIVDLMEPPKETIPHSVNIVGARGARHTPRSGRTSRSFRSSCPSSGPSSTVWWPAAAPWRRSGVLPARR